MIKIDPRKIKQEVSMKRLAAAKEQSLADGQAASKRNAQLPTADEMQEFWEQVEADVPKGCWEFRNGSLDYELQTIHIWKGKKIPASSFAMAAVSGDAGLFRLMFRQSCKNRLCVLPEHQIEIRPSIVSSTTPKDDRVTRELIRAPVSSQSVRPQAPQPSRTVQASKQAKAPTKAPATRIYRPNPSIIAKWLAETEEDLRTLHQEIPKSYPLEPFWWEKERRC